MMKKMRRNESGIAMVTVLLVGASLTAVVSVAAFSTVRDLKAGGDDRRGSQALAVAEAGVDRMLQYLRSGSVTWGEIRFAGCTVDNTIYPPLTLGSTGSGQLPGGAWFDVDLRVFNPFASGSSRFAPAACPTSGTDARGSIRSKNYFVITSTGNSPAARRVVRQVIETRVLGLPVGLHASQFDIKGQPTFENISVILTGNAGGRSFVGMLGTDPYYRIKEFWPKWSGTDAQKPAAIHALGTLYLQINLLRGEEHTLAAPLNCTANGSKGTVGQSQWDMSGTGGDITQTTPCTGQSLAPPPSSLFTQEIYQKVSPNDRLTEQDYQTLKAAAQERGIYCFRTGSTSSCTAAGQPWSIDLTNTITALPAGLENNFVAYFDHDPSATLKLVNWGVSYGRCQDPPSATTPNQSVTFVVRNGSLDLQAPDAGTMVVRGAAFVPDGTVSERGSSVFVGTIIAQTIDARSASSKFMLDECWVKNMPGPFLSTVPYHFSEVDR